MKERNKKAAKATGIKTLAILLALGMSFSAPALVYADETIAVVSDYPDLDPNRTPKRDPVTGEILRDPVTGEILYESEEDTDSSGDTGDQSGENGDQSGEDSGQTGETGEESGQEESTGDPVSADSSSTESGSEEENLTQEEQEAKEKAEQEAKEKAEQEAKEKAEKEAKEKAEKEAKEKAEQEAKEKAEQEAKEKEEAAKANEALIAAQTFVKLPELKEDWRFTTVEKSYAFAKKDLKIRESIPDGVDGNSEETGDEGDVRTAGTLKKNGLLYILKGLDNGWYYVESGTVRGFVKASELCSEDDKNTLLKKYQDQVQKESKASEGGETAIDSVAPLAEAVLSISENAAFTYDKITVQQTVADKVYAIVKDSAAEKFADGKISILEEKKTDARSIGTMSAGTLCYILKSVDSEWYYVESGEVRGYVKKDQLETGDPVREQVNEQGEDSFALASQQVSPEENKALYDSLASVTAADTSIRTRNELLSYASQFLGNPYVWGGTSLTDGADCSGFVQSVFAHFGYDLPRCSADQSQCGTKVAVSDAQPGDLIFYAENGVVYHVVIYAGDGQTIEASNEQLGIRCGTVYTQDAVWAVSLL